MPNATLGGKKLTALNAVGWTLKSGTRPHVETFDLATEDADDLVQNIGPNTLILPNGAEIEALYVIATGASDIPQMKRVWVADRRYWWSYAWVRRYYNIRRQVGVKRIEDPSLAPEAQSVLPDFWYAPWSVKDPLAADPAAAKWHPNDCLRDVFDKIVKPEEDRFGVKPTLGGIPDGLESIEIEGLRVNEAGEMALDRIMKYLPSLSLYIHPNGNAVVYSKISGAEAAIVEAAGSKVALQGDVRSMDNSAIRPKHIDILFQYEPEIRLDTDETVATTATSDTRRMDNVLPLPDFSGTINNKVECQGTWITFGQAYTLFGAPPGFAGPLNKAIWERAMVPFNGLYARLNICGTFAGGYDWAARLGTMAQHWRTSYRIDQKYNDRVEKWKPYRVATVNQEGGNRAPAVAYTDFCYILGQRAFFNEALQGTEGKDFSRAKNVKGHPALRNEQATIALTRANSRPAPCEVTITDSDQGIFHLDFKIDPVRLYEAVLPGMMTLSQSENDIDGNGLPNVAGPTADIANRTRPFTFDSVTKSSISNFTKLTGHHKLSVFLTAIPASPNDERVFYRIRITPQALAATLKAAGDLGAAQALGGIENSRGPGMEIHVGPGVEVARVAWSDENASLIDRIFGLGGAAKDAEDLSSQIAPLVVNDDQTGQNGASLNAIATATAARVYTMLADRLQGKMAANMNPLITPAGWLSEVRHVLSQNGAALSFLTLPEHIEAIDVFAWMDSSTRAMIMKLAEPGK